MFGVGGSPPVSRHRVLHRPQPLPVHRPAQGVLHVELLDGQQALRLVLLLGPAAAGEAASTASRDRAEQDPQQSKEHSTANQAGPDQLELQGLEAFVPDADEGDDEPDADHAEADVEDDVGAAAALQLVPIDSPVGDGPPLSSTHSSLGELQYRRGRLVGEILGDLEIFS